MHVYVVGIGRYMTIYRILVHIPNNLVSVVILIDHHYHPVCVTICDQVISSAHIPHMYWDVYENISQPI